MTSRQGMDALTCREERGPSPFLREVKATVLLMSLDVVDWRMNEVGSITDL